MARILTLPGTRWHATGDVQSMVGGAGGEVNGAGRRRHQWALSSLDMVFRYHARMPRKPVDPAIPPPWKRKGPPGKPHPLSTGQIEAARMRAAQAGRRYPNLVDNMWASRHVPRGAASVAVGEDE